MEDRVFPGARVGQAGQPGFIARLRLALLALAGFAGVGLLAGLAPCRSPTRWQASTGPPGRCPEDPYLGQGSERLRFVLVHGCAVDTGGVCGVGRLAEERTESGWEGCEPFIQ